MHILSKGPLIAQVNYYDQQSINVTSGRADEVNHISQPNRVSGRWSLLHGASFLPCAVVTRSNTFWGSLCNCSSVAEYSWLCFMEDGMWNFLGVSKYDTRQREWFSPLYKHWNLTWFRVYSFFLLVRNLRRFWLLFQLEHMVTWVQDPRFVAYFAGEAGQVPIRPSTGTLNGSLWIECTATVADLWLSNRPR